MFAVAGGYYRAPLGAYTPHAFVIGKPAAYVDSPFEAGEIFHINSLIKE
jgi:hypothetical protein